LDQLAMDLIAAQNRALRNEAMRRKRQGCEGDQGGDPPWSTRKGLWLPVDPDRPEGGPRSQWLYAWACPGFRGEV